MRLLLVDGSAILYRSFYGLAPLQTSFGQPTQAIFGFLRSLKKALRLFEPDFLVIAWDSQIISRKSIYQQYKENRQKRPSELTWQHEQLKEILTLIGCMQITVEGAEADDLIGTLVNHFSQHQKQSSQEIIIESPDKDLLQLVTQIDQAFAKTQNDCAVRVFDPFKDKLFDDKEVEGTLGFGPKKVLIYHALLGDASDNIPGVTGIGKTTAQKLAQNFSSVADLYRHLEEIEPKISKKLIEGKQDALLSEQLFTLQNIALPPNLLKNECFDFAQGASSNITWKNGNEMFEKLELKSFLVDTTKSSVPSTKEAEITEEQAAASQLNVTIIADLPTLKKAVLKIKESRQFAFDLETTGLSWTTDKIVGIAIAASPDHLYYLPVYHQKIAPAAYNFPIADKAEMCSLLQEVFSDAEILKLSHHGKFDQHFLEHELGIKVEGPAFDTAIAARLCLPEWISVGLKSLSVTELGLKRQSFTEVLKKHQISDISQLDIMPAAQYACLDALQTMQLYHIFAQRLADNPLLKDIFYHIEMPLLPILCQMEATGIVFDLTRVATISSLVDAEINHVKAKINAFLETLDLPVAHGDLNLNSPQQLQTLFFDILKLPRGKKGKKGNYSTNAAILEELAFIHPLPALILQYRQLFKLKSTYLEGLARHAIADPFLPPNCGVIHTDYSQTIVATGRLSSFEPNLQNIPQPLSNINLRSCFVARPGTTFIAADYSQIELRVLAELTKDESLVKAFNERQDIHRRTASKLFDKPESEITLEERSLAKKINFSILYGLSAFSLAKELKISTKTAQIYIKTFFDAYPKVSSWMEETVKKAASDGFITTLGGRRRWFRNLSDPNQIIAKAEARAAINAVAQGSAAELIKLAMIKLNHFFSTPEFSKEQRPQLLLQVHDEVLIECSPAYLPTVLGKIPHLMTNIVLWSIPLEINLKTGPDWGSLAPAPIFLAKFDI